MTLEARRMPMTIIEKILGRASGGTVSARRHRGRRDRRPRRPRLRRRQRRQEPPRPRTSPSPTPAKPSSPSTATPGGCDQKYAANQQPLPPVRPRSTTSPSTTSTAGIGTHLAIDNGLVGPGDTLRLHRLPRQHPRRHRRLRPGHGRPGHRPRLRPRHRLVQGPADRSRSASRAHPARQATRQGHRPRAAPDTSAPTASWAPPPSSTAHTSTTLDLAGRITIASHGAPRWAPSSSSSRRTTAVIEHCRKPRDATIGSRSSRTPDAATRGPIDDRRLRTRPLISRPGHPEDVVPVAEIAGTQDRLRSSSAPAPTGASRTSTRGRRSSKAAGSPPASSSRSSRPPTPSGSRASHEGLFADLQGRRRPRRQRRLRRLRRRARSARTAPAR